MKGRAKAFKDPTNKTCQRELGRGQAQYTELLSIRLPSQLAAPRCGSPAFGYRWHFKKGRHTLAQTKYVEHLIAACGLRGKAFPSFLL